MPRAPLDEYEQVEARGEVPRSALARGMLSLAARLLVLGPGSWAERTTAARARR